MKPSSRIWRETLKLAEAGMDSRKWPPELRPTTDGATVESLGFYKLPIKEQKLDAKGRHNGQWKVVDYTPVAVTFINGELKIIVGNNEIQSGGEKDSNFLSRPMSEEEYRDVVEQGMPFREFRAAVQVDESGVGQIMDAIAEDAAKITIPDRPTFDNRNPDVVMEPKGKTIAQMREENPNFDRDLERTCAMAEAAEKRKKAEPQIVIQRKLADLKVALPKFAKIESDEQSSAARGLQAKFLEIRGEAAGHYEDGNRPLFEQQKALRAIWFPIRDEADAAKTSLGDAMSEWETTKMRAARAAQEKADKEAREHAAAVAAAEAANRPAPPPPPEVKPNLPPPVSQIKAAGARTANVKLVKIVTEIDVDKAFAQFRAAPEVREVLMSLAQRAVTAGLPVDGATIEERSRVK